MQLPDIESSYSAGTPPEKPSPEADALGEAFFRWWRDNCYSVESGFPGDLPALRDALTAASPNASISASEKSPRSEDGLLTEDEIARRRDGVIRRMANTPPQPKVKRALDESPRKANSPKKRAPLWVSEHLETLQPLTPSH